MSKDLVRRKDALAWAKKHYGPQACVFLSGGMRYISSTPRDEGIGKGSVGRTWELALKTAARDLGLGMRVMNGKTIR